MGSSENLFEGGKILKRTIKRLSSFPQTRDRGQEFRGVHNRRGEARRRVSVSKVRCKG